MNIALNFTEPMNVIVSGVEAQVRAVRLLGLLRPRLGFTDWLAQAHARLNN